MFFSYRVDMSFSDYRTKERATPFLTKKNSHNTNTK